MNDEFICPVVSIKVEKHPNADNLEVAKCSNGKVSIVGKRIFKTDERVVCIPQHAIVPQEILKELGLEGRLAGKDKNIVKPIKLRDVYSDCILYPLSGAMFENNLPRIPDVGENMAPVLGIKKRLTDHPMIYEGVVANPRNVDKITYGDYDIENLYRWDNEETGNYFLGKEVYITEKIHGTWVEFSYHPQCSEVVTSKGYSKKELVFVLNENNKKNLYVNTYYDNKDKTQHLFRLLREDYGLDMDTPIRLMGEIYGKKVQDLHYNVQIPKFIAFDIYIGRYREGYFLPSDQFFFMCKKADIETVPLLYVGNFDDADLKTLGEGASVLDPDTQREGCVIKTAEEGREYPLGRTIAKYVAGGYLQREKGTEWN